MGEISSYLQNSLMNHVFGKASLSTPAKYLALSTADPLDDGSGIAEPSGNGYARVQVANSGWSAASSRAAANNAAINFAQATGAWGTCSHWAIFDSLTGGNLLAYGALGTAKGIVSGNTPSIGIGEISISMLTGAMSTYLAHKLLDHVLSGTSYTAPSIYAALSTANPGDTGSGAAEPSGNAYARVLVAAANWTSGSNGALDNSAAITFPTPTGSWGTVAYMMLMDALTSGNLLFYVALAVANLVAVGDTVRYPIGALDCSLD